MTTKPLNRDQLKFVRERLDAWWMAERTKIDAATTTRTIYPPLVSIVDGIRKGKTKVSDYYRKEGLKPAHSGIFLTQVFAIPELEQPRIVVDTKARDEKMKLLNEHYDSVLGRIMLSDQAEALKLLQSLQG